MRPHPITYALGASGKPRDDARAKIARMLKKHRGSIRAAAIEEGVAESIFYGWLARDAALGGSLAEDAAKMRDKAREVAR